MAGRNFFDEHGLGIAERSLGSWWVEELACFIGRGSDNWQLTNPAQLAK
jgi:hypothetical protein